MGFIPFEVISEKKKLKLKICGTETLRKNRISSDSMIVSKELLLYSESRES
jgi:hypothetical protein